MKSTFDTCSPNDIQLRWVIHKSRNYIILLLSFNLYILSLFIFKKKNIALHQKICCVSVIWHWWCTLCCVYCVLEKIKQTSWFIHTHIFRYFITAITCLVFIFQFVHLCKLHWFAWSTMTHKYSAQHNSCYQQHSKSLSHRQFVVLLTGTEIKTDLHQLWIVTDLYDFSKKHLKDTKIAI